MNLGTRQWKRLRRAILERDSYTCRVPVDATGWPTDDGSGRQCGTRLTGTVVGSPTYPCVDHVIDRRDGGSDDPSNLRAACWLCNGRRAARGTNRRREPVPVHVTREL